MLKCRVLCGNPLQPFGSGLEPGPEHNQEFGPVATTRYNGQCSEEELFSTASEQIQQISKALHTSTSSSKWRQVRLAGRRGPSIGSITQLTSQKEAFGGKQMRNEHLEQWREREIDWGLFRERDRLLQDSEFKMRRQRLRKSGKISLRLKPRWRQPESPKQRWNRCWMLLDTVWAIMQVLTISRIGKRKKMMKKIQCSASWGMTIDLAGWWAQSPTQYTTAWRVFGRSRWSLMNWRNRDVGTQHTTSVRE